MVIAKVVSVFTMGFLDRPAFIKSYNLMKWVISLPLFFFFLKETEVQGGKTLVQ